MYETLEYLLLAILAFTLTGGLAFAQEASPQKIDTSDKAWMLISSAIVLMMTVPGLALFYGGMVRSKKYHINHIL